MPDGPQRVGLWPSTTSEFVCVQVSRRFTSFEACQLPIADLKHQPCLLATSRDFVLFLRPFALLDFRPLLKPGQRPTKNLRGGSEERPSAMLAPAKILNQTQVVGEFTC